MPVKKLQQDVSTRWNSTYYMMQSLVEQKRALSAYATDYELPTTLTTTQWGIMEMMITLLEPFEQLTRDVSFAEATAADVIPGVVSLTRLLAKTDESDQGVQTAKHTLLEAVSKRFDGVQTEPLYAIATMVDDRYKDRYFDPDKKEEARNMLLKVVDEMASVGSDQEEDAAGASADDLGQEDQNPGWTCTKKFSRRMMSPNTLQANWHYSLAYQLTQSLVTFKTRQLSEERLEHLLKHRPLRIVLETKPVGRGLVESVKLKTKTSVLERPITKLCRILEADEGP
ncbi:hypothetical protein ACEWY4_007682 [Coilia grayii]|uniref:Uncharacterized protein n=1 Tax=Coilia grayii TaxID=363190 RepID=A0ABD1K8R3_9TELE